MDTLLSFIHASMSDGASSVAPMNTCPGCRACGSADGIDKQRDGAAYLWHCAFQYLDLEGHRGPIDFRGLGQHHNDLPHIAVITKNRQSRIRWILLETVLAF
jgi:hypothetical protein